MMGIRGSGKEELGAWGSVWAGICKSGGDTGVGAGRWESGRGYVNGWGQVAVERRLLVVGGALAEWAWLCKSRGEDTGVGAGDGKVGVVM